MPSPADRLFPVAELFGPTLAGEGAIAGRFSHFVRFGGCDTLLSGPCTWCDSMHAVDVKQYGEGWSKLTAGQIVRRVRDLPYARVVTLSGGNPCLYNLGEVVEALGPEYDLWVETQGTKYPAWLHHVNVTVSPKPPSAGRYDADAFIEFMSQRYRLYRGQAAPETALKIVVDPEQEPDLYFAEQVLTKYTAPWIKPHLSVVTRPEDTQETIIDRWETLIEWAKTAELPSTITILPQLHVLLWGHKLGV